MNRPTHFLKNEADLHKKVVKFIWKVYPNALLIPGLGEDQIASEWVPKKTEHRFIN